MKKEIGWRNTGVTIAARGPRRILGFIAIDRFVTFLPIESKRAHQRTGADIRTRSFGTLDCRPLDSPWQNGQSLSISCTQRPLQSVARCTPRPGVPTLCMYQQQLQANTLKETYSCSFCKQIYPSVAPCNREPDDLL